MYHELLDQYDTEFAELVGRSFPRYLTDALKSVLAALSTVQSNGVNDTDLQALLNALHAWRTNEPTEFRNRGGSKGAAYRLWMEAKQFLKNGSQITFQQADPIMPADCPGDTVLGVYVPLAEGGVEICHGFAYRWRIAAGVMAEAANVKASGSPKRKQFSFNGDNMVNVLYPNGINTYPPARANGVMQVQPRDLIGMYQETAPNVFSLGHSLIAETPTRWMAANNAGTFGSGTDRTSVETAAPQPAFGSHQPGWVGNGNTWKRIDGVDVKVVLVRP